MAVVPLFRYSVGPVWLAVLALVLIAPAGQLLAGGQVARASSGAAPIAGELPVVENDQPAEDARYVADLRLHSVDELSEALSRVDRLLASEKIAPASSAPIVFLLHGEESRTFVKSNYSMHRDVVNLAARLSALGVVDIQVCETWMGSRRIERSTLQPFVDTVPYAPAEEKQLLEDMGYRYL